jgi:hypothetical protein
MSKPPLTRRPPLADRVVEALNRRGIISLKKTSCVLGPDLGYPPGPQLPQGIRDELLSLGTHGLEVTVGRTVHQSWAPEAIVCPVCWFREELGEDVSKWYAAVTDWHEGRSPGAIQCCHCGRSTPVTQWSSEPRWAFGNLAFTFWNWPPLEPPFLEIDLARPIQRILRHRTVTVYMKI